MGLCLIAVGSDPILAASWLTVLMVADRPGHGHLRPRVGHFVVAKLCGVKCEKFYLGFDIFGWKLCKFTLGRDRIRHRRPAAGRIRQDARPGGQPGPAAGGARAGQGGARRRGERRRQTEPASDADRSGEPIDVEAAEQALYDPRSYLAQSVPKRMAIISAGVIMNVMFAW